MNQEKRDKIKKIRYTKGDESKIVMVTSYDAVSAKVAESCGIDLILVGDSIGMTVMGYENTFHVTVDDILWATKIVVRATEQTPVISDMPYNSFRDLEEAKKNSMKFVNEGGADGIKIEGGIEISSIVNGITTEGINVLGHIGMLPQKKLPLGKYFIHGKTQEEANKLLDDALSLEDAGCFAIIAELVHPETAKYITEKCKIPIIGIGSGICVDGQIQVFHDVVGLTEKTFKHSWKKADSLVLFKQAITSYIDDVINLQ